MQEDVQASEVLRVQDLGMGRDIATDRIVLGFVHYAEARIAKWVQFPRDTESGCFCVLDRLTRAFALKQVAEEPRPAACLCPSARRERYNIGRPKSEIGARGAAGLGDCPARVRADSRRVPLGALSQ